MPRKTQRRPQAEAPEGAETLSTANGSRTFVWSECPRHPWYGVSVVETGGVAMCVPPLDGTPNHYIGRVPS